MLPVRLTRRNQCGPGLATFDNWARDIDRLFNWNEGSTTWGLRADVREEDGHVIVETDLPGLNKDDINIEIENGVLTIRGEYKDINEERRENYHVRERRHGSFSRSFNLGDRLDGENVSAELNNGVLSVRIPVREEVKPKRIEVKAHGS